MIGVVATQHRDRLVQPRRPKHNPVGLLVRVHRLVWQMVIRHARWPGGMEIPEQQVAAVGDQPVDLAHRCEQPRAIHPVQHEVDDHQLERAVQWDRIRRRTDELHVGEAGLAIPNRGGRGFDRDGVPHAARRQGRHAEAVARTYFEHGARLQVVQLDEPEREIVRDVAARQARAVAFEPAIPLGLGEDRDLVNWHRHSPPRGRPQSRRRRPRHSWPGRSAGSAVARTRPRRPGRCRGASRNAPGKTDVDGLGCNER